MFMRYVVARADEAKRNLMYRIYVTDGLRAIVNPKATRYAELLKPVEKRTDEEIRMHIKEKLRSLQDGFI